MRLLEILVRSLEKLRERPRLFVPKLVSVGVSSVWILGLLGSFNESSMIYYLASYPLIGFLGVFVSVMVASMVEIEERNQLLKRGFISAAGRISPIVGFTLILMASGFLFSLPMSVGLVLYSIYGSFLTVLAGFSLSILLVLGASFFIYFVPISILRHGSALESIRDSASTSFSNTGEVSMLLLFSLLLLAISVVAQGPFEKLGAAGFVLGRLLNSVVTTYLFVISPEYYLSSQEPR